MTNNRIINLDLKINDPIQNKIFSIMKGPIEHVLAFPKFNKAYADVSQMKDSRPFPDKVLETLNISYDLSEEDLSKVRIPTGPVIIVANHPFGGIEGIILASLLRSVRCDFKFMANYMLNVIPEMREQLISVNPFRGTQSVRENIKPLRESIQWVKNGGMLVIFPSGTVSHFDLRKKIVTDPAWSPAIARLIRKTEAPVLPLFFRGANSIAFQMAGIVHPILRTALLPNELLNKKNNKTIQVCTGDLIPFEKLKTFDQDERMIEYLRLRTYLLELRHARRKPETVRPFYLMRRDAADNAIAAPQAPEVMADEIMSLLPSQTLVESGDQIVIQAYAEQIPHILFEIGRLREITFRAVGEGTGNAMDLDRFDNTYVHLFIWNRKNKEVVGAYRLGRTDDLVRKQGIRGLYTSTLFHYKSSFLDSIGSSLEMGRSFVRLEYQKSYAPLLLLWKGIGRFIVENPHFKTLFGPVSITNEYQAISRELMVGFLKMTRYRSDVAQHVRARKPLRSRPFRGWDIDAAVRLIKDDIDDVSDLISSIEKDRKGLPILLKQYIKLGGQIVGFNVDPAFSSVIDGLIMVDLTKTDPRMLDRYRGKEGAQHFLDFHKQKETNRYAHCA